MATTPENVGLESPKPTSKQVARGKATPVIAQFLEIKARYPDTLLFFRMGDFYELFFDDAVAAAAALDIALTKRGQYEGEDIPMCGVPAHASDSYLQNLVRKGFKVAVCEQMEEPAQARKDRGAKAVVHRDVVRLVTSGTLTEETLLDTSAHNYLAALALVRSGRMGDSFAMAWLDVSTGEFETGDVGLDDLPGELARLRPSEILVPDYLIEDQRFTNLWSDYQKALTILPPTRFSSDAGARRLKALFGVELLEGFGAFGRAELSACGAIVDYVELTQVGRLPLIRPPRQKQPGATMMIDAATQANLELVRPLLHADDPSRNEATLLRTMDRTVTGAGARLLAERLSSPLTDPHVINSRLDAVEYFVRAPAAAERVRDQLKQAPDMARCLSRLTLARAGPRDLAGIRDGLIQAASLRAYLMSDAANGESMNTQLPGELRQSVRAVADHGRLIDQLSVTLGEELPLLARDGGFVARGFDSRLDELRVLRDESRKVIAGLQAQYTEQSKIKSLKVRHNNVLGYFVEVTSVHADKLLGAPHSDTFIHRQTTASATRFTTLELSELEQKINRAGEEALSLEIDIFDELSRAVCDAAGPISETAGALARLDLYAALAVLARERDHVRPTVDDSRAFKISGGRHPVVEAALGLRREAPFVPNDADLSADTDGARRLWLLTGPNMAGKSTFLRQNALIAVMAQMGAFVPAHSAHVGVIDRLFSRVGAADDLARGRSTFMVEMVETAAILNQAGPRALVILDEIGRGTATFDGLSIAWAALEHLHEINQCRALFATHYHELTALIESLPALANATMRVKEWKGDVVFLHEVAMGSADRSYGIQVAKLAGLPPAVISRAQDVLHLLESGDQDGTLERRAGGLVQDLPLFAQSLEKAVEPVAHPLVEMMEGIEPDSLTPRSALELIYKMKTLIGAPNQK